MAKFLLSRTENPAPPGLGQPNSRAETTTGTMATEEVRELLGRPLPSFLSSIPPQHVPTAWRGVSDTLPARLPWAGKARTAADALHAAICSEAARYPVTSRFGVTGISVPFGVTHSRRHGRSGTAPVHTMQANTLYPETYGALVVFAKHFSPTGLLHAASVNVDFHCPMHVDAGNRVDMPSIAVCFGDGWTGGELLINGVPWDARESPVAFFGGTQPHATAATSGSGRIAVILYISAGDVRVPTRATTRRRTGTTRAAQSAQAPPALVPQRVTAGRWRPQPGAPFRMPARWTIPVDLVPAPPRSIPQHECEEGRRPPRGGGRASPREPSGVPHPIVVTEPPRRRWADASLSPHTCSNMCTTSRPRL